jgi:hypothetical protein
MEENIIPLRKSGLFLVGIIMLCIYRSYGAGEIVTLIWSLHIKVYENKEPISSGWHWGRVSARVIDITPLRGLRMLVGSRTPGFAGGYPY